MTDRQLIHSVDADDYMWLKALAEADGCGVGEIVRRCVRWARESSDESLLHVAAQAEFIGPAVLEQQRRERLRLQMIAEKQAELDALRGDEAPLPEADRPSVLDLDYSAEPRAEEVEVPPDPDDGPHGAPQRRPGSEAIASAAQPRAVPSLLDSTALSTPRRRPPGSATRPAAPNPNRAHGLQMGDGLGNVVRANFAHLGFTRGTV